MLQMIEILVSQHKKQLDFKIKGMTLAILEEFASKNLFNIMSKYNIFGMLPDIIANFFKTFVRVEENINC